MADLLVLGSAAGVPRADRFCTALAVCVDHRIYLLDCGAPVSSLLYRYGEDPLFVEAIFISHWHNDHAAGLPLLITQANLLRRSRPLMIYGPMGSEHKVRQMLDVVFQSPERLHFPLEVWEIESQKTYAHHDVNVTFFPTDHLKAKLGSYFDASLLLSYGMIVEVEGKKIVYSGDCLSPDELVPYIKGCDLLIHELGHHEPNDLLKFVRAHPVPRLIITHIIRRWEHRAGEIYEIFRDWFEGELIVAWDGLRISL